jgi:hypothetical protein
LARKVIRVSFRTMSSFLRPFTAHDARPELLYQHWRTP